MATFFLTLGTIHFMILKVGDPASCPSLPSALAMGREGLIWPEAMGKTKAKRKGDSMAEALGETASSYVETLGQESHRPSIETWFRALGVWYRVQGLGLEPYRTEERL